MFLLRQVFGVIGIPAGAVLLLICHVAMGAEADTAVHGLMDDGLQIMALSPAYEALLDEGEKVYGSHCAICHGKEGGGDGPVARGLAVKPRDFRDHSWMAGQADGGFMMAAMDGIAGSVMPAFSGRLSERELWSAVAYIRQMSPRKQLRDPASFSLPEDRGRELYAKHCRGCHGVNGEGDGPAARFFSTAPRDLTNTEWMAANPDSLLRGMIEKGVNGTPMPGFAGLLSAAEISVLVKYLRQISQTQSVANPITGEGKVLYLHHCAECHGIEGYGDGPVANQLSPPPRVLRNSRWQRAQSDEVLTTMIEKGRKGTAMPPFAALFSERELALLVQYLRGFTP
jgi:mono/diheme cytochrome c family protein